MPKDNRAINLTFSGSHACWTEPLFYVVFRAHFPAERACYAFGVQLLAPSAGKGATLIHMGYAGVRRTGTSNFQHLSNYKHDWSIALLSRKSYTTHMLIDARG